MPRGHHSSEDEDVEFEQVIDRSLAPTVPILPTSTAADDVSDEEIEFEEVGGQEDLADAPQKRVAVEEEDADGQNRPIEIVLEKGKPAATPKEKGKAR